MNLELLNSQQQQAVQNFDRPLLVLAGAGTGKTTVITYRIGWMIKSGIKPENIVALTFTNKAAVEMKTRIKKLLTRETQRNLCVSTFHAFGIKILRKHCSFLGYTGKLGIADEGDQQEIIKQAMGQLGLKSNEIKPEFFKNAIHKAKNHLQSVSDVRNSIHANHANALADVYDAYQRQLFLMNLVDFDDLIILPIRLWQENPEVLNEYRNQYRYVLVDEYQDTNLAQAEMTNLLAGKEKKVCVVGDDDQSIYGWRGADVANILNFPTVFSGTQIIKLEQNYRSTNVILSAANKVIDHNNNRHGKSLWSAEEEGDLIRIFEAQNETHEAKIVSDIIQQFKYERHYQYNEIVILFRSNFQTRIFEQTLRAHQIPYRLIGTRAFYDRREIKDALAYLKLIHNKYDDLSLLRILNVPPRGIGERTVNKLKLYKETTGKPYIDILRTDAFQKTLSEPVAASLQSFFMSYDNAAKAFNGSNDLAHIMRSYLENIGYFSGLGQIYKKHDDMLTRKENLLEFINSASLLMERRARKITLEEFLEINTLMDDRDRLKDETQRGNGVTLMTVHSAKGMEFTNVIIVGMEQNLFPHERAIEDRSLEEERRLFYVALTRAKKHVTLTRAKVRTKYNTKTARTKSCFLAELPDECITYASEKELIRPADPHQVESFLDALKKEYI